MGPRIHQIDNVDKLPQAAPHADSAPWEQQRRWIPDWRSLAVLCAFTLMLLLILYWLFGRDVRYWIEYGDGGRYMQAALLILFGYILLRAVISAAMRGLIIEQRGYKVPIWEAGTALQTLARVDLAYADRKFPNAAAVTITEAPPMLSDGIIDAEIVPEEDTMRLVPDSEWLQWIDSLPHLLLAGRTNAGKTTIAKAILADRISRGEPLFVLDPHDQPGKWFGIAAIGGGRDFSAILDALDQVLVEMSSRFKEYDQGKKTEEFERLTVLIDEVPALVASTMDGARTIDGRWKGFAKKLGSEARKVRISVILLTQSPLVADVQINSYMRENFTRLALGDQVGALLSDEQDKARRQSLAELLRGRAFAAALEYKGEIHVLNTDAVPALAARRNGHVARLWAPQQPPVKQVVSAAAHAASAVSASVHVPAAIVYPAAMNHKNAKIAWLLKQKYSYRFIEDELNVSHQTISQVKKAMGI